MRGAAGRWDRHAAALPAAVGRVVRVAPDPDAVGAAHGTHELAHGAGRRAVGTAAGRVELFLVGHRGVLEVVVVE